MSLRETYIAKLRAQLDEWTTQISILEIKAEQTDLELRMKYQQQLKELKAKRDEAEYKIADLQNATEEAWEEVKKGSESIWDTLKTTIQEVKSKFDR